jgi:hypothetical protein
MEEYIEQAQWTALAQQSKKSVSHAAQVALTQANTPGAKRRIIQCSQHQDDGNVPMVQQPHLKSTLRRLFFVGSGPVLLAPCRVNCKA